MAAVFEFEDVRVTGSGGAILTGVSCTFPAEGISVLVGPSGSGKSTLLRLCNRLETPSTGTVRYRGRDLAGLDPRELRREVGMVFPRPVMLGGTVRDNLNLARARGGDAVLGAALERVELAEDFLDRDADSLSTGEAQRACLARTLLTGPQVLLADEPTASVDAHLRRGLERLGRRLADEGMVILWVTHDLDQALRLADHLVVVAGGGVAAAGAPRDLASDPDVAAFFGGGPDGG